MKLLLVLGLLAIAATALWLVPQSHITSEGRNIADRRAQPATIESGAVGTTGTTPVAPAEPIVIREIETITGANDGIAMIGRRVDLHVDVQGLANDHSFWVGSPDNRLLVVLVRDASTHRKAPVHRGQRTAVAGVIRRIPQAEEMDSWDLTGADRKELADRKIYIRAESITTQNHGTF